MAKILISGGSGLLGQAITKQLLEAGHQVNWLSRTAHTHPQVQVFEWNPVKAVIDQEAFNGVSHVIHLAGANIFDKRWTTRYKKQIIQSRTQGAALLIRCIKEQKYPVVSFVGCSAVGYYKDLGKKIIHEESPKDSDFLAEVCQQWEEAYRPLRATRTRTCVMRLGIVLSNEGGALPKMSGLAKKNLLAPFAGGDFYFPWVHIQDAASAFIYVMFAPDAIGPYNVVATETVTNEEFSEQLLKAVNKQFMPPAIPYLLLRLIFGEKAKALVKGGRISNQRLLDEGFSFQFHSLQRALTELTHP